MSWFGFWLILHIVAAIVAFGPTFVFPVVGPLIGRQPEHALFGFTIFHLLETRLIIPFALTMPVSGVGLILTAHVDTQHSTWMAVSLVAYGVALVIALGHQLPATKRIVGILEAAPAGAPAGPPPPALSALVQRTRVGGMVLTVLLLLIIVMMIWRPGAAFS